MSAFSGEEPSADDFAKLETDLQKTVQGNDRLFALASGMREDWSLIAGFMGVFAERAISLRDQVKVALSKLSSSMT